MFYYPNVPDKNLLLNLLVIALSIPELAYFLRLYSSSFFELVANATKQKISRFTNFEENVDSLPGILIISLPSNRV